MIHDFLVSREHVMEAMPGNWSGPEGHDVRRDSEGPVGYQTLS